MLLKSEHNERRSYNIRCGKKCQLLIIVESMELGAQPQEVIINKIKDISSHYSLGINSSKTKLLVISK